MSAKLQHIHCRLCGERFNVTGGKWALVHAHYAWEHREEWKAMKKRTREEMKLKLPNKAG